MSHYLDAAREQAVWARVTAARQEPERPETPDCRPDCSPTPEQILDWICHECQDACLYHHLARCLPACAKPWLLEIAHDEQRHARRLAAQYYLMTGCKPHCCTQFRPEAQACELLRRQYQAELDGSAAYLDAAHCTGGDLSILLEELSKDEARHSRMVLCLLECVL